MSDVVGAIEDSFKSLVKVKPYRSITVKEICENAFVSRKTFYANFVDKRAVIAYLLRRDAAQPVERACELLSTDELREVAPVLIARFYQGVLDERDFYEALVKPMAGVDPTFELVVARATSKLLSRLVLSRNPSCSDEALEFAAYYHASAQAICLEKWICDGFKISPERLGFLQAGLLVPAISPLLDEWM